MRVTFEQVPQRRGFLLWESGVAVVFTVDFTEEEKAIIKARQFGKKRFGLGFTSKPDLLQGPTLDQVLKYRRFEMWTASPMHAKRTEESIEMTFRELKFMLDKAADVGAKRTLEL
jgi:hypothetical protein